MPQMSPMWWMTMMLMFNLTLMIMISNLFFSKNFKINIKKKYMNKINWKW